MRKLSLINIAIALGVTAIAMAVIFRVPALRRAVTGTQ